MAMAEKKARENLRPGPAPGPPTRKYTVLLEAGLGEWGKRQPGGLSALLRRLLWQARREARGHAAPGNDRRCVGRPAPRRPRFRPPPGRRGKRFNPRFPVAG